MSKEQEIEDIVNILCEMCDMWDKDEGYCTCGKDNTECWICCDLAKKFIKAGYRKIIPNVDFVVTMGELSTMREKAYIEGRRAAAKEIFKEVIKLLDNAVPNTKEFTTLIWLAGQIKTKYGIEVENEARKPI